MRPPPFLLLSLAVGVGACGPKHLPAGESDASTDESGGTTTTGGDSTSTSESSTGVDDPRFDLSIPDAPNPAVECVSPEAGSVCVWDDVQETSIAGDTPLGPVAFERAYFGGVHCECLHQWLSPIVLLPLDTPAPQMEANWETGTFVQLRADLGADLHDPSASLRLEVAGEVVETKAEVTFDAIPTPEQWQDPAPGGVPHTFAGTIVADQDGFSLGGSFEAAFCGYASIGIPCE